MHSWFSASEMMPATLALITDVGPPDWPTKTFPTSSAMTRCGKGLRERERQTKRTADERGKLKFPRRARARGFWHRTRGADHPQPLDLTSRQDPGTENPTAHID